MGRVRLMRRFMADKPFRLRVLLWLLAGFAVAWLANVALYVSGAISKGANDAVTNNLSWAAMLATVGTLVMEAVTQVEVEETGDETTDDMVARVCRRCGAPLTGDDEA